MTITDTMTRISMIQAQMASLTGAFTPPSAPSAGSTGTSGASGSSGSTGVATFASALAAAQGTAATPATGGVSAALPSGAASMLTSGQQQFASRLASDTGLDPGVVSAWLLAEESGSAAQSRESAGNNDWLNIGYTDSGTYGSADSVWSDPVGAADATAGWLKGQNTIPGYGTASSGIQAIVATAGQSPAAQMAALQSSGWASSGYPDLPSLYAQVSGT
jgi:hypothetical protein